jgi:hypothetical protein
MKDLIALYRKVELFFGNLKFAVVALCLFAISLGYGTFMESYHGTEYANRLVYKSWWFMGLQFVMFLSILCATLIRLPPKKHLYGFYVIHSGLIILFLGSYITYQGGVDGTVTLSPNLPTRQITLNEDEMRIQFPSRGKEVSVDLPFSAGAKNLKLDYENIKLGTFLPFTKEELQWVPVKIRDPGQTSSRYKLFNDNFGETLTLTLHPMSDFNNTLQLGPLNVHYMPDSLADCFGSEEKHGLIVWNGENRLCLAPTEKQIRRRKSSTGKEIVVVNFEGKEIPFLPEMSPLPLNQDLNVDESSPYRIFSRKLFENSPHLFLFGKRAAFFDKNTGHWKNGNVTMDKALELPWMGFKVLLLEHRDDSYPVMKPQYVKPVQEQGQVTVGDKKAIEVSVGDQTFWVRSGEPVTFNYNGEKINFDLGKKNITLPYEIVLDQFKMDTDPGTQNPASFESYVTVFKGNEGNEKHHIFMNHPLKHKNFTFYQASYFQSQEGPMGSVLSVNFDPGRPWKYLGSLLLVFGSIWHYFLRRKHLKAGGPRA